MNTGRTRRALRDCSNDKTHQINGKVKSRQTSGVDETPAITLPPDTPGDLDSRVIDKVCSLSPLGCLLDALLQNEQKFQRFGWF